MKIPRIVRETALSGLDDKECISGYMSGLHRKTCPRNSSYSFKHGWMNGASDAGYRPIDKYQRELARSVISG